MKCPKQLRLFNVPTVGEETVARIKRRIHYHAAVSHANTVRIQIPKIKHLLP